MQPVIRQGTFQFFNKTLSWTLVLPDLASQCLHTCPFNRPPNTTTSFTSSLLILVNFCKKKTDVVLVNLWRNKILLIHIQWSLIYLDPTYPDYLLIRTHVSEPIMIIYRESDSFIRTISYPDSRLGNPGVRISECPL